VTKREAGFYWSHPDYKSGAEQGPFDLASKAIFAGENEGYDIGPFDVDDGTFDAVTAEAQNDPSLTDRLLNAEPTPVED